MDSTINFMGSASRRHGGWVYKLILYLSFVWISIFPVASTMTSSFFFNYGNLIGGANSALSSLIVYAMLEALMGWLGFEIVFWLYRTVLSFKIYFFVVPIESLKNTSRFFYAIKNVIYGALLFLCFWYPYLYLYMQLFNIILIFVFLILYAMYLQYKFSQPIISHFVFKNFCYPVFVYECIMLVVSVVGVLV